MARYCTIVLICLMAGLSWCLEFDGVDDYVNIADSDALDITSAVSLETWIRLNGNTEFAPIIVKENTSQRSYLLYVTDSDKIRLAISDDGLSVDELVIEAPALTEGVMYHIVATFDTATQGRAIYYNASSQSLTTVQNSDIASIHAGTAPVRFGQWVTAPTLQLKAYVERNRIWDRALTATEVANLYRDGNRWPSNGTNAIPPVADWSSPEGVFGLGATLPSGTSIPNRAPNAQAGTDGVATNGVKTSASIPAGINMRKR